jgi:hypothetical protein
MKTRHIIAAVIAIAVLALAFGAVFYRGTSSGGITTIRTVNLTSLGNPTPSEITSLELPPSTGGEHNVTFEQIAACKAFPPTFWGIPWSVTVGNATEVQPEGTPLPLNNGGPVQGTLDEFFSNITFSLPNGAYSYVVNPSFEFFTPDSGNVTVAGSNVIVPIQYSGTSCTETTTGNSSTSQYANTSTITVATSSTTSTASTTCSIIGQPGGIQIGILSDSNSSPVVGAKVYATNHPDLCNGAPATSQTTITFATTSTNWYSLPSDNIGSYSFIVSYSDHNYTFSAMLAPVSMTCARLFIPSGHTNVTITEFSSAC